MTPQPSDSAATPDLAVLFEHYARAQGDASLRRVRLRCPLCGHASPVCDQSLDIRRELLARWWQKHIREHQPSPIIESVAGPS